jgi:ABC-2 type transport system ATP-binding protein
MLDIPTGSCFGLLGPNGAGKSTIINILGGSVVKTSGTISVLGYDVDTAMNHAKRKLGIVPQELSTDVFFSLYDALEMYAGYYSIRPQHRRTNEILEILGLSEKRNANPRQLSGGMRRRFLIAKALATNPEILILDEPTAGVDITLRDQLWDYVKVLHGRGTTIILTTHYFQEAETLCDHFAFINHGKVLAHGPREKFFTAPQSQQMTLNLEKKIDLIPPCLSQYEDIDLDADGLSLTFSFMNGHNNIERLLRNIMQTDISISSINTSSISLENIFKQIVF